MPQENDSSSQELPRKPLPKTLKSTLAILGVTIGILGIVAERYNNLRQQQHATDLLMLEQKVQRMTQIAAEFDTLYADTVALVTEAEADSTFLYLSLESLLHDRFPRRCFQSDTTAEEFRDHVNSILQGLTGYSQLSEIKNWKEAIFLEADWTSRQGSFTPDFALHFDEESHCKMRGLVGAALRVLSEVYAIFGDGTDNETLSDFKDQARSLSELLRQQIDAVAKGS